MTMVKRGVDPLRTAAKAEEMRVSPQETSTKGMAMLTMPRSANSIQVRASRGRGGLIHSITMARPSTPKRSRKLTRVTGPISWTAIRIQRKELPQIRPRTQKAPHCFI